MRDVQEEFAESVRYCYGHLSKFSFSVSLHVPFLNLLFETDSYSNEYLLAKIGVDTAENEPLEVYICKPKFVTCITCNITCNTCNENLHVKTSKAVPQRGPRHLAAPLGGRRQRVPAGPRPTVRGPAENAANTLFHFDFCCCYSSRTSEKSQKLAIVGNFFRAQAVEEALRKDRGCPVEKETLKKERRGGKRPTCYAAPSS